MATPDQLAAPPDAASEPSAKVDPQWLKTNLPCQAACPVHTHAGGYVSLISQGRFEEAYLLARRPNPFASICGRICAHPCEAACRRQEIDASVNIRALKRFVTERFGVESERSYAAIEASVERRRPKAEKGGRVAVIGAGPAGLSCAHDLALFGHKVVVYDAAPVAGGMMRLGIPEYRLPRELIDCEIGFIEHLGVELRLGVEVGKDPSFAELQAEYDAVFLAVGCRKGRNLKLPGIDQKGVLTAVDFLVEANLGHAVELGEEVLVVGGGNVAFDVARSAQRFGGTSEPDEPHHNLAWDAATLAARTLGKKVTLISLEAREEMPADQEEIEEAQTEGVTLLHRRGPHAVLGENGKVRALQTVDVSQVFDAEGRFSPVFVEGTEKEIPCDTVIFAIGQIADLSFLGEDHGLELTKRNTVVVDRESLATNLPGVYAGGDLAFGPRIVIEAVADGRRAAASIDTQITGRTDGRTEYSLRNFDRFGYEHPFARGDYEDQMRGELPMLPADARRSQAEVEIVLSEDQARDEGARCLHCWINTVFDSQAVNGSQCIQCGGCADVCPEDCIDLLSLTRVSKNADTQLSLLPDGSPLSIVGGQGAALIKDETSCIRCGLCARRCPVGCITMQGFYQGDDASLLASCERAL